MALTRGKRAEYAFQGEVHTGNFTVLFKRYWFAVIAFGLILSVDALADPRRQLSKRDQPAIETSQPITPSDKIIKRPNYYEHDCYQSDSHENADLRAQWRAALAAEKAAYYAQYSNWVSGVGAGLSFISIILVIAALMFSRDSNKIARDIGEAQARAYLGISKYKYEKGTEAPDFIVTIKNSGQSPARNVRFIIDWTPDRPTEKINSFEQCDYSVLDVASGESIKVKKPIDGLINENRKHFYDEHFPIWVHGMVQYDDVFHSRHHTWFHYRLSAKRIENSTDITISAITEEAGNEST